MSREDYDQIQNHFHGFLNTWKTKNTKELEKYVMPDVKCFMEPVEAYTSGAQHSLYGVRDFVSDMAEPDVFHIRVANYACRMANGMAQQSATVICRVAKFVEENGIKASEFSAMFANEWKKTDDGWKMSEIRMDIVDKSGDYDEFFENWHFEDGKAKWYQGVHLPVICGELDSPWIKVPEAEDVLTEEEKLMDGFYRYTFGIDTLSFEHVWPVFADDFVAVMDPWGQLDKRGFLSTIKFHRQSARHWTHSVVPEKIEINGNEAYLRLYRMAGHAQRKHPLVITRENVDTEHACARYEIRARKEADGWKVTRVEYFLGILEVGPYQDTVTAGENE